MKAGTTENMKFIVLKRILGIPKYQAIGLLEGLWSLAASSAQDGAIGKFSDLEIAAWLEWEGDHEALIEALIEAGFLDPCDENRLVVHDWEEHCPNYIKANLKSHGKAFKKPAKRVAMQPAKQTAKQPAMQHAEQGATKSSQVKSSQSKPRQEKHMARPAARNGPRVDEPEEFLIAWSKYPKRDGGNPRARALKAWRSRIREGVKPDELLAGLERYRQHCESRGIVGTSYVMQAATFFGPDRRWEDDWGPPEPPNRMQQEAGAVMAAVLGETRVVNGEVVR